MVNPNRPCGDTLTYKKQECLYIIMECIVSAGKKGHNKNNTKVIFFPP